MGAHPTGKLCYICGEPFKRDDEAQFIGWNHPDNTVRLYAHAIHEAGVSSPKKDQAATPGKE